MRPERNRHSITPSISVRDRRGATSPPDRCRYSQRRHQSRFRQRVRALRLRRETDGSERVRRRSRKRSVSGEEQKPRRAIQYRGKWHCDKCNALLWTIGSTVDCVKWQPPAQHTHTLTQKQLPTRRRSHAHSSCWILQKDGSGETFQEDYGKYLLK